jgi:hypothetical protein
MPFHPLDLGAQGRRDHQQTGQAYGCKSEVFCFDHIAFPPSVFDAACFQVERSAAQAAIHGRQTSAFGVEVWFTG